MYKGNKRQFQKECVLIVDPVTGEFTLEKLASSIQLKKTRYVLNITESCTVATLCIVFSYASLNHLLL